MVETVFCKIPPVSRALSPSTEAERHETVSRPRGGHFWGEPIGIESETDQKYNMLNEREIIFFYFTVAIYLFNVFDF